MRAELVLYFDGGHFGSGIPEGDVVICAVLEYSRVGPVPIELTDVNHKMKLSAAEFRSLAQLYDVPIGRGRLVIPWPDGGPAYVVRDSASDSV